MIHPRIFAGALFLGAVAAGPSVRAQNAPDLAPPQAREKVVAESARVLAALGATAPLPSPPPNPFVAKDGAESAEPARVTPAPSGRAAATPAAPLVGSDLLAQLASRIPATGVITLGGQPILLLGQKRLKVGDAFTISLEDQTYELSIVSISATSFTVKRGEFFHSRPVRIAAP